MSTHSFWGFHKPLEYQILDILKMSKMAFPTTSENTQNRIFTLPYGEIKNSEIL